MLEPRTYPTSFPLLSKFEILRKQAKAVGLYENCAPTPLMTAFSTCETVSGVKLHSSTLSSQDSMGLNDGSKNTVLTSYIADAWNWGAEIFCGCEVQYVLKNPSGGYNIYFRDLSEAGPLKPSWVHASKLVFIGAGSIGTTEIVLRSKERGLSISPQVGQSLSGNGSMLTFGHGLNERVNSLGRNHPLSDPPGPTISGMIDCRNIKPADEGFLIQDGAFPTVMALFFRSIKWLLPTAPPKAQGWLSTWGKMFSRHDPLDYSQVYLTLGHDNAIGKMSLQQDIPCLDMTGVAQFSQKANIKDTLKRMTHAFGGTFIEDGVKACVHPLGGMGVSFDGTGRNGATKHTGEAFSGEGDDVHDNLVVVDAALIPRSLGTNPVATITALAERAAELAASRVGLTNDLETRKSFEAEYPAHIERIADDISFSETMKGFALIDGERSSLTLIMHIIVKNLGDTFTGEVAGSAQCAVLSKDTLKIQSGTFRPFQRDPDTSMTWIMLYDLVLLGSSGETFHFEGAKRITPSIAFSPFRAWQATTNLELTLRAGEGRQIGTAAVKICITDFVRQLRSFKARPRALFRFFSEFAAHVAKFMFVPFAPVRYPQDYKPLPTDINPKIGPALIQSITASDGFKAPLRMYEPTSSPNGEDLLFIPGGAVTHEIYALESVRQNAIEYFTARGYRCWCITHRAATIDRATEQTSCTAYDARLEVVAALEFIYAHRKNRPVLIVAHCAGTVALASGLLSTLR